MFRLTRPVTSPTPSSSILTPPARHYITRFHNKLSFKPNTTPTPLSHLSHHRNLKQQTTLFSRLIMATSSSPTSSSPPSVEETVDDFVSVEAPVVDGSSEGSIETNPDLGSDPNVLEGHGEGHDGDEGEEEERERSAEGEGEEVEVGVSAEEVIRKLQVLTCENGDGGTCQIYLVGTAHVSEESCKEVQTVISHLKPEVVFLELCPSRVAILTLKDLKVPTMSEMIEMYKKKQNLFGIVYSWFLAKVADKLEVLPGSEFRVGFEEAMKYGGKVILGDRPVQVTLQRTWAKMPLWHKAKLVYSMFFQAVFLPSPDDLNRMLKEMNDVDMLTLVIQEMSKEFPTLMETLVNERDQYMASQLLRVASEHSSVVAVVGKGHVNGIKREWKKPVELHKLLEIPSRSPIFTAVKILAYVGGAVTGAAIISGIYIATKKQS